VQRFITRPFSINVMAKYIIAYLGGQQFETTSFTSKEEGMAHQAKWKEWVSSLGDAVVNAGTPLKNSKIVSAMGTTDGGPVIGYAVVKADSMDAALEIAKKDPYLNMGKVQVSEMIEMK
jgi:hypothetical protein